MAMMNLFRSFLLSVMISACTTRTSSFTKCWNSSWWIFHNPRWWNDNVLQNPHWTSLFHVCYRETAHFIVHRQFAPTAHQSYHFLEMLLNNNRRKKQQQTSPNRQIITKLLNLLCYWTTFAEKVLHRLHIFLLAFFYAPSDV